jgi:hypothetical protein
MDLSYESAERVERYLLETDGVTTGDLHGALCNAMRRIAYLESRLEDLAARVAHDDTRFKEINIQLRELFDRQS